MKTWTSDNPKAGLLERKRAAILAAARRQFLAHGYGGTSMEAVADDAGVSIMTLYRHAQSKDELFAAVVGIACHDADAPPPDLSQMTLAEILNGIATMFQHKLSSPETLALLRAVIAEQDRFPDLARIAFDGIAGQFSVFLETVLAGAREAAATSPARRTALAGEFIDDLCGADTLRALLGLPGSSPAQQAARADAATVKLLAGLGTR
ncbi:MAG: helix-turn-helix transcriptional regulator [Devosia nanyangense]|uniref:Helix-turn-helix transcriptional regulator n=1 Tax=Devosia nanyangense TaxID=1228055 RepID=A0A933KY20_9HYPH|nr:helix-turn-helix transcriptional regulator [Devosia nanyangense]